VKLRDRSGQVHGREDLLGNVLGLDEGDEAQRSVALTALDVDRERPPEKIAPRDVL
jgi:hypothetical protein